MEIGYQDKYPYFGEQRICIDKVKWESVLLEKVMIPMKKN